MFILKTFENIFFLFVSLTNSLKFIKIKRLVEFIYSEKWQSPIPCFSWGKFKEKNY
jgi:hypothetical protein